MARPNSRAHRRRHRSQGSLKRELLTSQREQNEGRFRGRAGDRRGQERGGSPRQGEGRPRSRDGGRAPEGSARGSGQDRPQSLSNVGEPIAHLSEVGPSDRRLLPLLSAPRESGPPGRYVASFRWDHAVATVRTRGNAPGRRVIRRTTTQPGIGVRPQKISGLRRRTLPGVQTAWLGVWAMVWGLEGVVARLGGPVVMICGGSRRVWCHSVRRRLGGGR